MEEIQYCVDCENYIKDFFTSETQTKMEHSFYIPAKCKAIMSVVTKQPCECELAREGHSKCKHYKQKANPKRELMK